MTDNERARMVVMSLHNMDAESAARHIAAHFAKVRQEGEQSGIGKLVSIGQEMTAPGERVVG